MSEVFAVHEACHEIGLSGVFSFTASFVNLIGLFFANFFGGRAIGVGLGEQEGLGEYKQKKQGKMAVHFVVFVVKREAVKRPVGTKVFAEGGIFGEMLEACRKS
ncbi:MAG: hypothetical protein ABMA02_08150 [Saprospiraceae bacterium]